MGFYDREYYRRDGPGFLASLAGQGQVCKWLIIINVAVFILQLATRQPQGPRVWDEAFGERVIRDSSNFTDLLVLNTRSVLSGQVWRLLTYAFLHDTAWQHIVFNMLFLWWFGSEVEDLYGPKEFLAFYLVAAVLGGVAFVLWALALAKGEQAVALGASGAVTAAMVLFALHYPTRQIYIWFLLPVPIWLFVIFQVAQDTIIWASGSHSRTAVTIHLAGAAFGFLYYKLNWRVLNWWESIRGVPARARRPRLRLYEEETRPEPVAVAAPPAQADVDEQLEAKLDAVLEKVSRTGKESLTDSERAILLRASEVYRRRRS